MNKKIKNTSALIQGILIVTVGMGLGGCAQSPGAGNSDARALKPIQVKKLVLSNNVLSVHGANLDQARGAKLGQGITLVGSLKVIEKSSELLRLTANSAIKLAVHTAYHFIISSAAGAEITVPFIVELPGVPAIEQSGGMLPIAFYFRKAVTPTGHLDNEVAIGRFVSHTPTLSTLMTSKGFYVNLNTSDSMSKVADVAYGIPWGTSAFALFERSETEWVGSGVYFAGMNCNLNTYVRAKNFARNTIVKFQNSINTTKLGFVSNNAGSSRLPVMSTLVRPKINGVLAQDYQCKTYLDTDATSGANYIQSLASIPDDDLYVEIKEATCAESGWCHGDTLQGTISIH